MLAASQRCDSSRSSSMRGCVGGPRPVPQGMGAVVRDRRASPPTSRPVEPWDARRSRSRAVTVSSSRTGRSRTFTRCRRRRPIRGRLSRCWRGWCCVLRGPGLSRVAVQAPRLSPLVNHLAGDRSCALGDPAVDGPARQATSSGPANRVARAVRGARGIRYANLVRLVRGGDPPVGPRQAGARRRCAGRVTGGVPSAARGTRDAVVSSTGP